MNIFTQYFFEKNLSCRNGWTPWLVSRGWFRVDGFAWMVSRNWFRGIGFKGLVSRDWFHGVGYVEFAVGCLVKSWSKELHGCGLSVHPCKYGGQAFDYLKRYCEEMLSLLWMRRMVSANSLATGSTVAFVSVRL